MIAYVLDGLVEVERDLGQTVAFQVLEIIARLPVHVRAVALEHPRMIDKLLHGEAPLRVSLKQVAQQVDAVLRKPRGQFVFAVLNFLVQQVYVVVIKGQVAAQ